jgi:hypothetical protein
LPGQRKRESAAMPLKLLDYGEPSPFGEIFGRKRKLAWPVNVYRVTLPKPSDNGDGLNPFERVILKIIDAAGTREAGVLAQKTCIPVDLVQCVLLRLKDKAFIDEYNQIVDQRRNNWMAGEKKEPVFVTALLFRELATGKILPFLHQVDNENPLKKKEEEERYFHIPWDNGYENYPIDNRDVIMVLRAMKKRLTAFDHETRMPAIGQISIVQEPEMYYLDCPIAIQKSDGEFRIADPFGSGFSRRLEDTFSILLEKDNSLHDWFMKWKQNLAAPRIDDKSSTTKKEPFETDDNIRRYEKLVSNLRIRQNTHYRSIEQIHSALEWALFYACTQRQYDTAVRQFRITDQEEHAHLLKEAAEKVGLIPPQYGFQPVLEGRLDDFLDGKAELITLLSITLLMAGNDASHPLRRIAVQYQDFIIRLLGIKKKRDEQAHGKGKNQKDRIELPEDGFMREIITALLPDIRFSNTPVAAADRDRDADLRLDSRINIQNEFGFRRFNLLGTDLQNNLIYAERLWVSCKNDGNDAKLIDAQDFASDLYAALQAMFRKRLAGRLPPDIKDSEFIARAQANAAAAELGELPESLCTINPFKIRQTLQGNDQTLGACAVAFLLVSSEDVLRMTAAYQPSFLSDVSNIIVRRGHGNEPLPLSKNDIAKIRKSTYSTIKTLLEAYP